MIVAIYVDDILMCSTTEQLAEDITAQLEAKVKCVNFGEISWCLGMQIQTSECRDIITLDLDQYIQSILARYELEHLPAVAPPMSHDQEVDQRRLTIHGRRTCSVMEDYPFRSAVSSLMFAMVAMRVDILYAVISVARFTANPGLPHWQALVRIFQYLKGTSAMKLTYSRVVDTPAPLLYGYSDGYSDADWATTDVDERRTCIGYCIFLSGAAIFWLTQFWKPCLSTFEGELAALTEVVKTAIAARELLASTPVSWFEQNKGEPTTLLIDAAATKQAAHNPKHHSRAKHMVTFLAWIRHVVHEGLIRTQTIPRVDNLADFMVKAHTKASHRSHTRHMMSLYQQLKIRLTSGESLKRRIEDALE